MSHLDVVLCVAYLLSERPSTRKDSSGARTERPADVGTRSCLAAESGSKGHVSGSVPPAEYVLVIKTASARACVIYPCVGGHKSLTFLGFVWHTNRSLAFLGFR